MKMRLLSRNASPRTSVMVAATRCAVFIGLGVVAASLWCCWQAGDRDETRRPLTAAAADKAPGCWYLRSGQWRADLRTLAAAVRYLKEKDGVTAPAVPSGLIEVAMPTNSTSVAPKA